jgi:hypothetical protein
MMRAGQRRARPSSRDAAHMYVWKRPPLSRHSSSYMLPASSPDASFTCRRGSNEASMHENEAISKAGTQDAR